MRFQPHVRAIGIMAKRRIGNGADGGIAAFRRHFVAAIDACIISIAVVIAGLDPAIHGANALARTLQPELDTGSSPWMRGSSPRMTSESRP
jgi:hypothetical protein